MIDMTCTCEQPPPHKITCPAVSSQHRNAMICPDGGLLYPASPEDAQLMMQIHDARYVFDEGDIWLADDQEQP